MLEIESIGQRVRWPLVVAKMSSNPKILRNQYFENPCIIAPHFFCITFLYLAFSASPRQPHYD